MGTMHAFAIILTMHSSENTKRVAARQEDTHPRPLVPHSCMGRSSLLQKILKILKGEFFCWKLKENAGKCYWGWLVVVKDFKEKAVRGLPAPWF